MKTLAACALMLPLLTSGCGYSRIERAGSGAVIGGVTGATVGTLCCGDPLDGFGIGFAIGAASGGAIGAMLDRPLFFNYRADHWPYGSTDEQLEAQATPSVTPRQQAAPGAVPASAAYRRSLATPYPTRRYYNGAWHDDDESQPLVMPYGY